MTTPIRVFSFDGGSGGPTYVRLLKKLEQDLPGTTQATDLFVGSSFGTVVSLYLAQNLVPGADAVQVIEDCITATDNFIASLLPEEGDYLRLLTGWQSLTTDDRERAFFEDLFGDGTLGDLPNKVLIISGRGQNPWQPLVMSNFGPNMTPNVSIVDAALRSCAFPVWMPMQDGYTDGFLFTNNPASVAIAAIVDGWQGTRDTSRLDQIRLLSVGQDSGTSVLTQFGNPKTLGGLVAEVMTILDATDAPSPATPLPIEPLVGLESTFDAVWAALERIDDDQVRHLTDDLNRHRGSDASTREDLIHHVHQVLEPMTDEQRAQFLPELKKNRKLIDDAIKLAGDLADAHGHFRKKAKEMADTGMHGDGRGRIPQNHPTETPQTDDTTDPWGWIQWLAWLTNPVWLLQAMMTNQGLGVHGVNQDLLAKDATWRIAPMGLMTSNDVFVLLFLRLQGVVEAGSEVCADLWSWWLSNVLLEFDPNLWATHWWIKHNWLEDE